MTSFLNIFNVDIIPPSPLLFTPSEDKKTKRVAKKDVPTSSTEELIEEASLLDTTDSSISISSLDDSNYNPFVVKPPKQDGPQALSFWRNLFPVALMIFIILFQYELETKSVVIIAGGFVAFVAFTLTPKQRSTVKWLLTVVVIASTAVVGGILGFFSTRLGQPFKKISRTQAGKMIGLKPPMYSNIVKKTVETTMSDGVKLIGSLYLPDDIHSFPVVLVRSPYGRERIDKPNAILLAERGYACLLQDTRGKSDSGGDFFPIAKESKDGGETLEWVAKQKWCNGKIGLYGVSYLGMTAYASAGSESGHLVDCLFPVVSPATSFKVIYHNGENGPLALELVIKWMWLVMKLMEKGFPHELKFFLKFHGEVNEMFRNLPLQAADTKMFGEERDFFQAALAAEKVDDPFWRNRNVLHDLQQPVNPPCHMISAWHDLFMKITFNDFVTALKNNERKGSVKLTMYDANHWVAGAKPWRRQLFDWLDVHLKNHSPTHHYDREAVDYALRLAVVGTSNDKGSVDAVKGTTSCEWFGFNEWPPRDTQVFRLILRKGALLANCVRNDEKQERVWIYNEEYETSEDDEGAAAKQRASGKPTKQYVTDVTDDDFSTYVYDPAKPTPYVGGPSFDPYTGGAKNQKSLEKRKDVLTFTSQYLSEDVYIAGEVFVVLNVTTSNPNTDFFVKLCNVNEKNESLNVCENIHRMQTGSWTSRVKEVAGSQQAGRTLFGAKLKIKVGDIAACFKVGHRIRLQVSGGAHPLYMRNLGVEGPQYKATEMKSAEHTVFHRDEKQSVLMLPLLPSNQVQQYRI